MILAIQNLTRSRVDRAFVRRVIRGTLRKMRIKGTISLDVVFVTRAKMCEINKKYRRKNKVTDVLSFSYAGKFVNFPEAGKYLGEIIVCPEEVKKKARGARVSFYQELTHVLIHSTLHLLGWEHGKNKKRLDDMHSKEEKIMEALGV